jgi:hypothetical protein
MIRKTFREESMSRTRVFEWKNPKSLRPQQARQVDSKVKIMFIICFEIKGIVRKEFVLAGQTVNSAHYCDVLWRLRENMRRLRPEL